MQAGLKEGHVTLFGFEGAGARRGPFRVSRPDSSKILRSLVKEEKEGADMEFPDRAAGLVWKRNGASFFPCLSSKLVKDPQIFDEEEGQRSERSRVSSRISRPNSPKILRSLVKRRKNGAV